MRCLAAAFAQTAPLPIPEVLLEVSAWFSLAPSEFCHVDGEGHSATRTTHPFLAPFSTSAENVI